MYTRSCVLPERRRWRSIIIVVCIIVCLDGRDGNDVSLTPRRVLLLMKPSVLPSRLYYSVVSGSHRLSLALYLCLSLCLSRARAFVRFFFPLGPRRARLVVVLKARHEKKPLSLLLSACGRLWLTSSLLVNQYARDTSRPNVGLQLLLLLLLL